MDISVVILSWNSLRYIQSCLSTLMEGLLASRYSFEVFIVDNGSVDGTREILASWQKEHPVHIKPIFLQTNTGTTYSRNLAIKQATGKHVVIMDSDIRLSRGVFESLIKVFDSDARIGLVVPRLRYPSGNLQKSTDDFPTLPSKAKRYFFLKWMEKNQEKAKEAGGVSRVEYAISAFWVLKREVIDKVGLLDENIFYAPEDVDYCLRVWKAGYSIVIDNSVVVEHDAQEISRGFRLNRATVQHIRGLLYYFRKHRYVFFRPRF